jgi:hypothetical protein
MVITFMLFLYRLLCDFDMVLLSELFKAIFTSLLNELKIIGRDFDRYCKKLGFIWVRSRDHEALFI